MIISYVRPYQFSSLINANQKIEGAIGGNFPVSSPGHDIIQQWHHH